jgi:hypothetical protein
MYKHIKNLAIIIVASIVITTLCSTKCRRSSCHQYITVVNNSDSIVSICNIWWFSDNTCSLDGGDKLKPKESATIRMTTRTECLEDMPSTIEPATNYTLFILPETFSSIHTTFDSLYLVYDILKTIDLKGLGLSYLEGTDYTVYYP